MYLQLLIDATVNGIFSLTTFVTAGMSGVRKMIVILLEKLTEKLARPLTDL